MKRSGFVWFEPIKGFAAKALVAEGGLLKDSEVIISGELQHEYSADRII